MKHWSDGEVLMARSIWFQICGAAEEKARLHSSQRPSLHVLVQI